MIKIFKKNLIIGSLIIFSLLSWQIKVIADESSVFSTSSSVNTNPVNQTNAKIKNSSENKNSIKKLKNLLGIRTDFVYNNQNDTTNTLRIIVYLIQKEQDLYHPVHKADASQYKVTMKAIFYVSNKIIYKNEYHTDKTGEITIYLDEISKVMNQTKGDLRIELEPLSIGKLDPNAMKYHDKVYREFSLPIPSRSDKNLTSKSSEDKTMTSTLIENFLIGGSALLIGCLIGYMIGKHHGKRIIETEILKTKFDHVPEIKVESKEEATNKTLEQNTETKDALSPATVPKIEDTSTEIESTEEQLKKVSGEKNSRVILMPGVNKSVKKQPKQTQISKEDIPKKSDIKNNTEYSSNDESAMFDQLKSLREHAQQLLSSLDD
ncbi:MAG: hypothetical protein LBT69_05295 [Lactobacillales bacterium]|jgi:hypothetical protein|nr:hypothetical protein [Lactobacillales bacterium]